MTLDTVGKNFIKKEEGCELAPYKDSAGVATIGYGNIRYEDGTPVKMTDKPITQERADALWEQQITQFVVKVSTLVKSKVTQNQFNAMVSLCENIGGGSNGFAGSTVLKRVNANPNDPTIRSAFAMWNKAGGVVNKGLTDRRQREANLYFS